MAFYYSSQYSEAGGTVHRPIWFISEKTRRQHCMGAFFSNAGDIGRLYFTKLVDTAVTSVRHLHLAMPEVLLLRL